ncbi:hypothetical protein MUK42_34159 [Musa troglodytarum]|uniref:Uncharacterized protein n=1 Tax=Musa troglodytarum TaxID=320322 RepID=A0A9E7HP11_9LILI|nr:hypothetical protein MUK42_34159 [Musa troglodytarum]
MPMDVTGIPRPTQHLRLMSRPNSITSSRCWHGLRNPKEPHRPEPTPPPPLPSQVQSSPFPAISPSPPLRHPSSSLSEPVGLQRMGMFVVRGEILSNGRFMLRGVQVADDKQEKISKRKRLTEDHDGIKGGIGFTNKQLVDPIRVLLRTLDLVTVLVTRPILSDEL